MGLCPGPKNLSIHIDNLDDVTRPVVNIRPEMGAFMGTQNYMSGQEMSNSTLKYWQTYCTFAHSMSSKRELHANIIPDKCTADVIYFNPFELIKF